MADFGQSVGAWLRGLMEWKGWNVAAVVRHGKPYKLSRTTVEGVLKAKRPTKTETVEKIARTFGVIAPEPFLAIPMDGSPAGAKTPREALHVAKQAIERAERLLGPSTPTRSVDAVGDAAQAAKRAGRPDDPPAAGTAHG